MRTVVKTCLQALVTKINARFRQSQNISYELICKKRTTATHAVPTPEVNVHVQRVFGANHSYTTLWCESHCHKRTRVKHREQTMNELLGSSFRRRRSEKTQQATIYFRIKTTLISRRCEDHTSLARVHCKTLNEFFRKYC